MCIKILILGEGKRLSLSLETCGVQEYMLNRKFNDHYLDKFNLNHKQLLKCWFSMKLMHCFQTSRPPRTKR